MKLNKTDFQIRFKRGLASAIQATATLALALIGEPHWTTDTNDLYVYDGAANQYVGGASRWDANADLVLQVYTDATRPAAGTPGRVIFNSDDGQLNIDNGTDWTLPDGTVT